MKTIIVTKEQILEAVRTEPLLSPGFFFETFGTPKDNQVYAKCNVCAVGAVLRSVLSVEEIAENVDKRGGATGFGVWITGKNFAQGDSIEEAIRESDWMGVLSVKFENLCYEDENMDWVREVLAQYVTDVFPPQVSLTF